MAVSQYQGLVGTWSPYFQSNGFRLSFIEFLSRTYSPNLIRRSTRNSVAYIDRRVPLRLSSASSQVDAYNFAPVAVENKGIIGVAKGLSEWPSITKLNDISSNVARQISYQLPPQVGHISVKRHLTILVYKYRYVYSHREPTYQSRLTF